MTLAATALAYQRNTKLEAKRFMGVRDTLELGQLLYSFDDPLGIDYYTELTLVRAGRSWGYKLTEGSPWSLTLGVKAFLGWAWASSVEDAYKDVSNPFFGGYTMLALSHATWGQLYTDDRVVAGYTLGSPATGKSISREARIRFGYFKKFEPGWTIDLFFEKRSFNFSDPELPDLYTKARLVGGLIGYQF